MDVVNYLNILGHKWLKFWLALNDLRKTTLTALTLVMRSPDTTGKAPPKIDNPFPVAIARHLKNVSQKDSMSQISYSVLRKRGYFDIQRFCSGLPLGKT